MGRMTVLRAQVIIPRDNALPADACINTWHFQTTLTATPSEGSEAAFTQLETFYQIVDTFLASYNGTTVTVKIYDLSDDPPRVPINEDTFTIAPASGAALPAEVAAVLSFRGELASGTSPARRRGRIFLGPLDDAVIEYDTPDERLTASIRGTVVGAAEAMVTTGLTADGFWVVFSPTLAGPPPWSSATLEDSSVRVLAGYMDNACDTVRSRGALPSARSTFSVTLP